MLVSICLQIVLILMQDSCTVCAKCTIGLEIILEARGSSGSSSQSVRRYY
jgi:hypothetical protein